ncbi:hypothetical protein A33Q_1031 [Indibacter alkaliphilus LW1]|uniref:Uncharacterized protein n=1 Tax=Indibacter alkaliphilus (strain CCUG 57479 / KCTC 22604 / LW1) TaxID=1189612 RepID=S2DH80_INDAL|nr:hypothetical protein A33Q_1031 [Indibacter alkaliphilus LW1]
MKPFISSLLSSILQQIENDYRTKLTQFGNLPSTLSLVVLTCKPESELITFMEGEISMVQFE